VIRGGESDCRNRILHQMFLLIGLGERGGSGMPRIYGGWKSQHWRPPALTEKDEPEQTLLMLQMADLLPEDVLAQLRERFGALFDALDYTGRLVMATAALERVVGHNRLLEICGGHSHDLSLLLARLVKQGLLASDGRSRGMVYFLPGEVLPTPEQVFMGPALLGAGNMGSSSEYSEVTSEYSEVTSGHSALADSRRDLQGRLLTPHLDAPIVDDLSLLDQGFLKTLEQMAEEPRQKERLGSERMEQVVTALCRDHFVTLSALAELVNRHPDGLRQQYLSKMVRDGRMVLAFPTKPTHERQAYRAADGATQEIAE
jgi:hypothetical protein